MSVKVVGINPQRREIILSNEQRVKLSDEQIEALYFAVLKDRVNEIGPLRMVWDD
jgi:hypothetical protein